MDYESLIVFAVLAGAAAVGWYVVRGQGDTMPVQRLTSEETPERHTDWRSVTGLARSLSLSREKTIRERIAALVRWLSLAVTALLWLYAITHLGLYQYYTGKWGGRLLFLELAVPGAMGLILAEAIEYWYTSPSDPRARDDRDK